MSNTMKFECSICGCEFVVSNKKAEHMVDHVDPAEWICKECNTMMDGPEPSSFEEFYK